jgi:hypothetical protein
MEIPGMILLEFYKNCPFEESFQGSFWGYLRIYLTGRLSCKIIDREYVANWSCDATKTMSHLVSCGKDNTFSRVAWWSNLWPLAVQFVLSSNLRVKRCAWWHQATHATLKYSMYVQNQEAFCTFSSTTLQQERDRVPVLEIMYVQFCRKNR